ncbi:MAG: peptidylprolyl isomerase [Pseudomonadota bacterium]
MLTRMREGAKGTVAKVFLILVSVAVVAGLGFGSYFGGIGQRTVLAVGDAEISAETFEIALRRQLNQLSQQIGTGLTMEQARMFGLDRQLLSQLASEAALDSEADRLNIGVSDPRLAERIASDPIFLQVGGFNRQFFQQVLRSYGISEDDFVADTRSFAARQQLAEGVTGGLQPPQFMLEVANTYANELRKVSYLRLTEENLEPPAPPTDEELVAFYNERTSDYRAPEYRSVEMVVLSEAALADPAGVPEDEVRAAYEQELGARAAAGQRDVTQLLFTDAAVASRARDRLAAGESVSDLQADDGFSFTVTELGSVRRDAILDDSAGDAAFALAAAGPTGVIEGRFGNIIMVVNSIGSESTVAFENLEGPLRDELARARARDDLFNLFDAVEDARAGGDTLATIAERFDLELVTVAAVDSNGFDREGNDAGLPETDDLLGEMFETDVGLENDVVDTADGGFVWYDVTGIEAARDLTFEEAESRVRDDFIADQRDNLLRDRTAELVDELERGRTLETLSLALDVPLQQTEPFTRGEAPDELGGPATVAAFEGAEGHFGDVEAPDRTSRLVFVVTDVARPAFFEQATDVQQLAEELGPSIENSILTQYVGALQASLGVQVNQDLLNQLLVGGIAR